MAKRRTPRLPGPFSHWVKRRRALFFVLIAVVGVGLDQASKVWVQSNLSEVREVPVRHNVGGAITEETVTRHVHKRTLEVIPGYFDLIYVENDAAAFSLSQNLPRAVRMPLLVAFSALVTLLLGAWYWLTKRVDGLVMTGIAILTTGALGNLIDRVRVGYVIDFVDLYVRGSGWPHFATFNVADLFVAVGSLMIIIRTFVPLAHEDDDALEEGVPA